MSSRTSVHFTAAAADRRRRGAPPRAGRGFARGPAVRAATAAFEAVVSANARFRSAGVLTPPTEIACATPSAIPRRLAGPLRRPRP